MSFTPSDSYRKTRGILRRGSRSSQPLATTVLIGTLYDVNDEGIVERSNGTIWEAFSAVGPLPGEAARIILMQRHSVSNTAGNSLTVQAGGATSGATNKNGGDLVLQSGISTGFGDSKITFNVYIAGASGTSDNAPTTALTLRSNIIPIIQFNGTAIFLDGGAGAPGFSFTSDLTSGFYLLSAGNIGLTLGGDAFLFSLSGVRTLSSSYYSWSAGPGLNTPDLYLRRGAAGILDIRDGANSQKLRIYNTYTNGANYERLLLEFVSNVAKLSTGAAGSGTVRDLQIGDTATARLILGIVKQVGAVSTAGSLGTTAIVANGRSTAQTAAVASVSTFTVGAADGSFEVSANILITTATLYSFTVTCAYTDESNTARTLTLSFSSLVGTFLTTLTNTGGAGPYEGVPLHIRCKASTAITIATVGTFTTVTYNVESIIKQTA